MKRAGRLVDISNFEEIARAIALKIFGNSAALNSDAFARQRISEPFTIFDSKQVLDNAPLFFDDSEVSGGGTSSTWSKYRASTTMATTALTAGKRVRQTKMRFNYQPGKSLLLNETFVALTPSGNKAEIGFGDTNNGVFLRLEDNTPEFFIRSSVTGVPVDGSPITQANWNVDKMDGTGDSEITLDFTKAQIFFVDLEWLGVGTVAFGFFVNRTPYYAHFEHHANDIDSVYMSTPNLPIHYSIENDGTGEAGFLEHICSTVISEGGVQANGIIRSVDRDTTAYSTGNNTNIHPLLSIRLKSTHLDASIEELFFSIINTSNVDFRWVVLLNPTIAGTDNANWTPVADSAIEYDITRDNTNTLSGDHQLASGYGANNQNEVSLPLLNAIKLGATIAGDRDEIVLGVQNLTSNPETYYAAVNYRELQ